MTKELYIYNVSDLENNATVSPFGQNRSAEIAYRKAERLVLATQLVTNFVPENEPVRKSVRSESQRLLSNILALREGLQSAGPDAVTDVTARVRFIISLLDAMHASGYISTMNLSVLKKAYIDLVRFLQKSEDGTAAERLALTDEHFMSVMSDSKGQLSKGQIESIKDKVVKDIKDTSPLGTKKVTSVKQKKVSKSRRMAILDVVTKKSPIHIKDIKREMPEWSEKTIQRELGRLVEDGVVKKEGSKRWTMYSLVV